LSDAERKEFASHTRNGLDEYLEALKQACELHAEHSVVQNALNWFEPLFKTIELFQPVWTILSGTHPGGTLALGGVMSILQATNKLDQYQSSTLKMLAKMGRKSRLMSEYETDLYKDDNELQILCVQVIGDILAFCQKGVQILDGQSTSEIKAKIKGLKLAFFHDFESRLGEQVDAFEQHMEQLEMRAAICDKKRLKQALDALDAQRDESSDTRIEHRKLLEEKESRLRQRIEDVSKRILECKCTTICSGYHLTRSQTTNTRRDSERENGY
jgi:hypothetical protein